MKRIFAVGAALSMSVSVFATDVQLVVEKVDNQGVVAGNTYRIYAQLPSAQHSLHAVWGDTQNPISIHSTAPFYQNEMGAHNSSAIHPNVTALYPALKYDSYITLGYADAIDNTVWDIGFDFSTFNNGGDVNSSNGAWFLLPDDEKCSPNNANLVLIAQLTTTGTASGTLNLQGKDANQQAWKEVALSFTTENAKTFGCTDQTATNFIPSANFNDGSCAYKYEDVVETEVIGFVVATWSVFPNPVKEQLIHIQFNEAVESSKLSLEILDMRGKRVAMHELSKGNWSAPNRVTIEQNLAAGSYQIVLTKDGKPETKTLVVSK